MRETQLRPVLSEGNVGGWACAKALSEGSGANPNSALVNLEEEKEKGHWTRRDWDIAGAWIAFGDQLFCLGSASRRSGNGVFGCACERKLTLDIGRALAGQARDRCDILTPSSRLQFHLRVPSSLQDG